MAQDLIRVNNIDYHALDFIAMLCVEGHVYYERSKQKRFKKGK